MLDGVFSWSDEPTEDGSPDSWPSEEFASLDEATLLELLGARVSEPTARAMIHRASEQARKCPPSKSAVEVLVKELVVGARMFLDDLECAELERELRRRTGRTAERNFEVQVENEHDARRARMMMRAACTEIGIANLKALKTANGVNELAQNILQWAKTGVIQVEVHPAPHPRVRIVAADHGPAIESEGPDGEVRSLEGLATVRRLADKFEVISGPTGTRVVFEVSP